MTNFVICLTILCFASFGPRDPGKNPFGGQHVKFYGARIYHAVTDASNNFFNCLLLFWQEPINRWQSSTNNHRQRTPCTDDTRRSNVTWRFQPAGHGQGGYNNADAINLVNLQEKRTVINENPLRRDSSMKPSSLDCCSGMKKHGSVFKYRSSEQTNNITISFKNKTESHIEMDTEKKATDD